MGMKISNVTQNTAQISFWDKESSYQILLMQVCVTPTYTHFHRM